MNAFRPSRFSQRTLALASCLALVGAQAATYVHLATVRHVTCAEHGELVELGGSASRAAPAPAPGLSENIPDAGTDSHHHDHCLFAVHGRTGATAPAVVAVVSASDFPSPAGFLEGVHTPPAPDLLAAPKQSPPQA